MTRDELKETLMWAMLDGTPFLRGNEFDAAILAECCMKVVEIELKNEYSRGHYAGRKVTTKDGILPWIHTDEARRRVDR